MNLTQVGERTDVKMSTEGSEKPLRGGRVERYMLVHPNWKDQNPDWLHLRKFEAETTIWDKVNRAANDTLLGVSLFALYGAYTAQTGIVSYASYATLGLAARKVASTMIGYMAYPAAASSLISCSGAREKKEKEQIEHLAEEGFIVRKISLHKSGTKYDAVFITRPETIANGNWTINALGNETIMEFVIEKVAKKNFSNGCNTLLVNGPSVGLSGGWPTRYQMGAGFEAGLQFLEREVKAVRIVMHGFSLGGGMMGEAILNHDFTEGMKRNIRYLSISDRTFGRLSGIAGALTKPVVKPIFYITGTELDGVGAARKLSALGVRQIVIQHNSQNGERGDGKIPAPVSLAYELRKEDILKDKTFIESNYLTHNDGTFFSLLPKDMEDELCGQIKKFIENSGTKT
jgi:Chlamydia CHLPS protein (DUF818)